MFTKARKEQWLKDLRSGEYKQGAGVLCQIDANGIKRHCCIGVYAEQLKINIPSGASYLYSYDEGKTILGLHGATLVPLDVARAAALANQFDLARLNDNGHTFSQIADWIEANMKAVDE